MVLRGYQSIAKYLSAYLGDISPKTLPKWARRRADPLPVCSVDGGRGVGKRIIANTDRLDAWVSRRACR